MTEENLPALIDIGANLTHDSFDQDRDEVLERAAKSGVTQMVITGTSVDESIAARELAALHPGHLYATAGLHPHHADDFDESALDCFADLAGHDEVVAIGECGLDFFRNFSTPKNQERAFEAQLELASKLQLPVFLHQRDAHDAFIHIIKQWRDRLPAAVAHCFTGSKRELYDYLDLDLHIGITGWICDERRGKNLQEAVSDIPPGRLMIETDAPYLLPRDLKPTPKSRRNEPMHLPHILQSIAGHCQRPAHDLAQESTRAARQFFQLATPTSSQTQA